MDSGCERLYAGRRVTLGRQCLAQDPSHTCLLYHPVALPFKTPFLCSRTVLVEGLEALAEQAVGHAGKQKVTLKRRRKGCKAWRRGALWVAKEQALHCIPSHLPALVSLVPLLCPRTFCLASICNLPLLLPFRTVNTHIHVHTYIHVHT